MHRRRLAVAGAFALLAALAGCAGEEPDRGPYRYVAERIVALPDGSIAVAGMATAGSGEDSGCRVGGRT